MRIFIYTFISFLFLSSSSDAGTLSTGSFNQAADIFLKTHVKDGKVDYPNLKDNFVELEQLYKQLAEVDLSNAGKNEKMAFYINAYNVIVIHQIAKYYPLKSALDKNGFFDKVKHQVAGEELTLDQVEKGKVIIPYRDPRVHFAFSCAAIGCPELANFAFMPENLDRKLEERTKNAINNPDFILLNNSDNEVKLSMIFKWYDKDFKMKEQSILAYINKYRNEPIPDSYTISYYSYNWDLNIR